MNIIPEPATGWAVKENDAIDANTVCQHRRGAIVNWLVAGLGLVVPAWASDEQIEKVWEYEQRRNGRRDPQVIEVLIKEIVHVPH